MKTFTLCALSLICYAFGQGTSGLLYPPLVPDENGTCGCDDIVLDVPNLSVDLISLEIDKVSASVAVNAEVLKLVKLNVGVDVGIEKVSLTITDVKAQLSLNAKLNNVYNIFARTMDTIDRNPDLLPKVVDAVGGLVGTIGDVLPGVLDGVVNLADSLLSTINDSTGTIQRIVDSLGNIVVRTLDPITKDVLGQVVEGSILAAPNVIVSNTTNAAGQIVLKVRDVASGNLVDVVMNTLGSILSAVISKV